MGLLKGDGCNLGKGRKVAEHARIINSLSFLGKEHQLQRIQFGGVKAKD